LNYVNKTYKILPVEYKKRIPFLVILLFIGLIFETAGLGILIPYFSILLDNNTLNEYPLLSPIFDMLGNPSQTELVIYGIIFILFFYLIKSIFQLYSKWKLISFVTNLTATIMDNLFKTYLRRDYKFHTKKNSSEMLKNIQIETQHFIVLVQSLLELFLEITVLIGVLIVTLLVEPIAVLIAFSTIGTFVVLINYFLKKKILNLGQIRQELDGNINKIVMESLSAIKEIKVYNKEEFFSRYLYSKVFSKAHMTRIYNFFNMIPRSFIEFVAVLALSLIISISVFMGYSSQQILIVVGIFGVAAFKLIPSANKIISHRQQIIFRKPSVDIIYDELNIKTDETYINNCKKIKFLHSISISNLYFRYDNESKHVIKDLNLNINKGDVIGIIGESGVGKSTLVDLILGLFDPESGSINVDSMNILENINGWKKIIGYVPQTINLIDEDLVSNILLGIDKAEIDNDRLKNAIKLSQLESFINNLNDGLKTVIGERGVRISGGQRQRIGIARALYYDPEILIFDEATSSLDSNTELGIMKSIDNLIGRKTIIIISHKMSTLNNCNKIYKLIDGKLKLEQ
tara:strand:+ start:3732 stop:5450 length:1719 start_codon:yes stop_codon:yes gene_type:complete